MSHLLNYTPLFKIDFYVYRGPDHLLYISLLKSNLRPTVLLTTLNAFANTIYYSPTSDQFFTFVIVYFR